MDTKFFVRPGENEWIQTQVTMTPEQRSALHGVVKNAAGQALADVLVMLFETTAQSDSARFSSCLFTDETGEFAFGPLSPNQLYVVKVFKNNVKVRELEIVTD